ncbi:hypothetical protein FOZ63_012521 [Perkinsus olseni]|uniref:Uncharacterized protein n=1 Tax=Perkinsus olseni TaxID=32597 RepID=A0A7J6U853_PEROL|nr:hypothetical protein FOZ62_004452 [Perkinsus olseni]KAF4753628.1 hypothetical protein FOZ63_012521 [Perkinsus olseni]
MRSSLVTISSMLSAALQGAHSAQPHNGIQGSLEDIFSDIVGRTFCQEDTDDHIRTIGITFTKRHRAPHAADVVAELDVVAGTGTLRHYHSGIFTVTTDEGGELSFENAEPDGFDEFFKLVHGDYDLDTPTVTAAADGLHIGHGYKFIFIPYEDATAAEDAYDHDWLSGCP